MSQLGLGVLIDRISGGGRRSAEHYKSAEGKTIVLAELKDDRLRLHFTDGTGIEFFDNGQSCCESRYMVCDDDLAYYAGAKLLSAEIAEAPNQPDEDGDEHEVQFLRVTTSRGVIVCSNHNEHNGYYGGFSIQVEELAVENDR